MTRIFLQILSAAILIFASLPARALNNVDCKNFIWGLGNPASFTYDPSLPVSSFQSQFTVDCEWTPPQVKTPPPPAFNVRPVTLPSDGKFTGTYVAPGGATYTLKFGFYGGVNCSSIIRGSGPDYWDSGDINWPTPNVISTYYTFSTTSTGYHMGVYVCPIAQSPWPRPGVYSATVPFEYAVWNENSSNVHSLQYWPNTGSWDTSPAALPVNITVPAVCTLTFTTTPPVTLIAYTSFGPAKTGSTIAANARCNTNFWFTFDKYNGTLAGVKYDLVVKDHSTSQVVAFGNDSNSVSQTWSGVDQPFDIMATAIAGQPGACTGGCSGSAIHTLIVNY